MSTNDTISAAEDHMGKAIARLHKDLATIRTGRPNAAILDRIMVDYYGTDTPLKGLANISTPDGKSLVIQPYDKSALKAIETAINKSDLGLTPNTDKDLIRINFPPMTAERRTQLIKQVHKMGEEIKVAIRNARRDADQHLKKLKGEISEDDIKRAEETLQKTTDKNIKEVDKVIKDKEDDLNVV